LPLPCVKRASSFRFMLCPKPLIFFDVSQNMIFLI
jgi:hypothetical protein